VLRVISSSPGELGPVFDVILESAARLCRAAFGSLLLKESKVFRRVAVHNPPPLFAEFHKKTPIVQPQQIRELRTLVETNRPVHVADAAATDTDSAIVKYAGGRTLLIVPMLKENELIGTAGRLRSTRGPASLRKSALPCRERLLPFLRPASGCDPPTGSPSGNVYAGFIGLRANRAIVAFFIASRGTRRCNMLVRECALFL
jgi:hypothetical protein